MARVTFDGHIFLNATNNTYWYPISEGNNNIMTETTTPTSFMDAERNAIVHPVSPKRGAFLRPLAPDAENPQFVRFDRWEDGKIRDTQGGEWEPDAVEALVPLTYGLKYKRVVPFADGINETFKRRVYPMSGDAPWSGLYLSLTTNPANFRATSFDISACAGVAPVLDPTNERPRERAARLEREMEALQFSMNARMSAEGKERQWCEVFDGVLASTGLPLRRADANEWELVLRTKVKPGSYTKEQMNDIIKSSGPGSFFDYISFYARNVTSVEIVDQPEEDPSLTLAPRLTI